MDITVVLVRHGETYANRSHTLQGQLDYKLNSHGHLQASKAADWLASEPFDDAYSSDLSRAFDTASTIVKKNKIFNNINRIRRWEILRERKFGIMEGRSFNEFAEEARKSGFSNENSLWHYTPEGAESLEDLRDRAAAFFELFCNDLASRWGPEDNPLILLVTHGVLIKELMIHLVDERQCELPEGNIRVNQQKYRNVGPNTGITRLVLSFDEEGYLRKVSCPSLYTVNHLDGLEALGVKNIR